MKIKKNKKIYNFTKKQKRRDSLRLCSKTYPIGKELKIWANRKFRRDNQAILKNSLKNKKEIPFKKHRKFLSWYVD